METWAAPAHSLTGGRRRGRTPPLRQERRTRPQQDARGASPRPRPRASGRLSPAKLWHDWFNAAAVDAIVRVEVTPGERFGHLIETLFGLAREGHVNGMGMPNLLQLALTAAEFSD